MDFSKIDSNNKSLDSLLKAFGKTRFAKSDFSDETEWTLTKDKEGNGQAKIRFIPSADGEFFVEVRSHGFKLNDSWYIENCPKTLDWENKCPACEYAGSLKYGRDWDKIPKSEQTKISPIFAKTSYWANILVEKDPTNPENEGKVFKFRFGKKILEKIYSRAIDDPLDGTKGINIFDPVDGASFKLKSKKVAGFLNYDDSSFDVPAPILHGDNDKIDALIKTGVKITDLRKTDNFKSYDDLKKKLARIVGASHVAPSADVAMDSKEETKYDSDQNFDNETSTSSDTGEDEDAFKYFQKLADGADDIPF